MSNKREIWPTVFPPIDVTWNTEASELVIVGTIGVGVDQQVRHGIQLTPEASKLLLLLIRGLLERVDADAIDTRPRGLQ
jgi:hypothetical protein